MSEVDQLAHHDHNGEADAEHSFRTHLTNFWTAPGKKGRPHRLGVEHDDLEELAAIEHRPGWFGRREICRAVLALSLGIVGILLVRHALSLPSNASSQKQLLARSPPEPSPPAASPPHPPPHPPPPYPPPLHPTPMPPLSVCAYRTSQMTNLHAFYPPRWCKALGANATLCALAYVGFESDGITRCTAAACSVLQRCAVDATTGCVLSRELTFCALPPSAPIPPLPPPELRGEAIVERMNARFSRGHASNNVEAAGVFLRGVDLAFDMDTDTPWEGKSSIVEWFRSIAGDRISGSIMNQRLPYFYKGLGPLFAVRPSVVEQAFLCGYHMDASSFNSKCPPSAEDAECLPGCYSATRASLGISGWCNSPQPTEVFVAGGGNVCPFPLSDLQGMMQRQGRHTRGRTCSCCSWPDCALYNEVVLDSKVWSEQLPKTIEAICFLASDADGKKIAERWRSRMLGHFHLQATELPLVRIGDIERESAPFSLVE
ncbi:hypothetical protein AB1Y20_014977 [Prymnesium parvum]|uniref:Uncharacterized protein n=1 Tax=Prymnesium parvum TaxID=97485 RepID=A0AB34JZ89_PRYPA